MVYALLAFVTSFSPQPLPSGQQLATGHAPRASLSMAQPTVGRRSALLLALTLPVHGAAAETIEEIAARNSKIAAAEKASGGNAAINGFEPPQTVIAKALAGDTVKQAEDRAAAEKEKKSQAMKEENDRKERLAEAKAARAAAKAARGA